MEVTFTGAVGMPGVEESGDYAENLGWIKQCLS